MPSWSSLLIRIIPAYAGSTPLSTPRTQSMRDHPRIRGEHQPRGFRSAPGLGSSPHTRGARSKTTQSFSLHRIIPAYAGSTLGDWLADAGLADHPRIRGEHSCSLYPWVAQGRIIPAYAGSTFRRLASRLVRADHPRIRGEHAKQALNTVYGKGSSPHTRGARAWPDRCLRFRGIIPAYAGSTCGANRRRFA